MRILIAPDSFKGSLSPGGVADSIEQGLAEVLPEAQLIKMPLSDGGDGLTEVLIRGSGGKMVEHTVCGPMHKPVQAYYGVLGNNKTVVMEMAAASGLHLIPSAERDPLLTTTWGTGELIREAVSAGFSEIILGIGGSATVDGGMGMAQALGVEFFDVHGRFLDHKLSGKDLSLVGGINAEKLSNYLAVHQVEFTVACDVDNPLCGPEGAARIYGPQKGATPEAVEHLETGMRNWSGVIERHGGRDVSSIPGSGAAGGLGAALLFFLNALLVPGFDLVAHLLHFDRELENAQLVFTGEGKIDAQTVYGKVPYQVAKRAKSKDIPVVAFTGWVDEGVDSMFAGKIDVICSIIDRPMKLEEAFKKADGLLTNAARRLGKALKLGKRVF